jgi:hypothetical protein
MLGLMAGMLSQIPSDRLALLRAARFSWHELRALWFSHDLHKIIGWESVRTHDVAWLKDCIAQPVTYEWSMWFESTPTSETVRQIVAELGR